MNNAKKLKRECDNKNNDRLQIQSEMGFVSRRFPWNNGLWGNVYRRALLRPVCLISILEVNMRQCSSLISEFLFEYESFINVDASKSAIQGDATVPDTTAFWLTAAITPFFYWFLEASFNYDVMKIPSSLVLWSTLQLARGGLCTFTWIVRSVNTILVSHHCAQCRAYIKIGLTLWNSIDFITIGN